MLEVIIKSGLQKFFDSKSQFAICVLLQMTALLWNGSMMEGGCYSNHDYINFVNTDIN